MSINTKKDNEIIGGCFFLAGAAAMLTGLYMIDPKLCLILGGFGLILISMRGQTVSV